MRKMKAITFSFDDGVQQDKRLIEIFDRYSLKATFNINSGMFDKHTSHEAMLFSEKMRFNNLHPTLSHRELETREKLADEFLALEAEAPKMFYIWGHSYEMINEKLWEEFERFCEKIAGKDDIFYGTNHEVFDYFGIV